MERNLAYLLPENLHRVFNEADRHERKEAIADFWDLHRSRWRPSRTREAQHRCHGFTAPVSGVRV